LFPAGRNKEFPRLLQFCFAKLTLGTEAGEGVRCFHKVETDGKKLTMESMKVMEVMEQGKEISSCSTCPSW
jgi:hypothetical protein